MLSSPLWGGRWASTSSLDRRSFALPFGGLGASGNNGKAGGHGRETAKDGDSAECWRCGPSGCASWLDQRRMEQIYLGRLRDRCECLRKAFSRTLPQRADEAQELELEANGAGVLSGTGSVSPKPGTHGLGGSTRRWWRPAARSCLFGSAVWVSSLQAGREDLARDHTTLLAVCLEPCSMAIAWMWPTTSRSWRTHRLRCMRGGRARAH